MKLFKIFKKAPETTVPEKEETTAVNTTTETTEQSQETPVSISPEKESKGEEIIAITYGTGMPIDIIYAYIGKDYEDDGYKDALVNSSVEYCKAKENIILNKLQQLFRQVSLSYKGEIRNLEVQIENSKSLFNLTSAAMLEARKETCEEHIEEINQMLEKLKAEDPEMMTMIDSYRRGFSKGFSAQTANFLSATR